MPTVLENLQTAKENLAKRYVELTAASVFGPTYSVGGQSVDIPSTLAQITAQLKEIDLLMSQAGGPYQISSKMQG